MELSLLLGKQIASMLLIAVFGFISVKAKIVKPEDSRVLSTITMYLVCPFSIYHAFQMDFSLDKLSGFGLAMAAAILAHVIFILLNRITRPLTKETPIESASVIYSNSMNLVLPLLMATLGGEWVFYTAAFCAVQTFLFWSHGISLIREETKIEWKKILNMNIIAIFLGMASFILGIRLPSVLETAVEDVASLIGPVCMLVMGMLMGGMDLKKTFTNVRAWRISLRRLLVYPAAVLLIFRLMGITRFHPDGFRIIMITMMAAASCTASSVVQMASVYGKNEEYSCVINVITLVLCVVTMPLIIYLYQVVFA